MKTDMKVKLKKRNDSVFARRFITCGVVISSIMVVVGIFVSVFFNAEAVAHRKFEMLAREYYEDYYYDKFMATIDESVFNEKMATFANSGLKPVPLRQILLYQNGKNSAYKKYFEREGFSCDKSATTAQFFPVEPYGKKDYTVEFSYSGIFE